MDNVTQRLIALGNRLLAELRLLSAGIQQLFGAVHDAKEAQNQQDKQQPPVVVSELQIPEAVQRDHGRRDDRSYSLQKWLTVGTWLAFIAAAIYAGVAHLTYKEIRNQTASVRDAADAATSAAGTAKTALENSEKSFKIEERAYVFPTYAIMTTPPICVPSEIRVCADVHYANSGRTPALGVQGYRYATFGDNAEREIRAMKIPAYIPSNPSLGLNVDRYGTAFTKVVDEPTAQRLVNAKLSIYIYGVLQYFDIFGDYHETGFCYQRVLDSNAFIGCEYGNWFDKRPDDKK